MAIHERDQDLAAHQSVSQLQVQPEQPVDEVNVMLMDPARSPEHAEVSSSSSARSFGLGGTSIPWAASDAR